jgi:hypothetical protein
VVQRLDPDDRVHVVRLGRHYPAHWSDVEPRARVVGARVHFDIARDGGVETATNVALRQGTRTGPHHRRFGDLSGARQPGDKVPTTATTELGVDVTTQPMRIAQEWAAAVADGRWDDAMSLYATDAAVHAGGAPHLGRTAVRTLLEEWASSGQRVGAPDIRGADRYVRVAWEGDRTAPSGSTFLHIDGGRITEQWIDEEPPRGPGAELEEEGIEVVVVRRGAVTAEAAGYARQKLEQLIEKVGEPVLFARVKLGHDPDPAVARPARAEGTLDVNGTVVRSHASGTTLTEAADLLEGRLQDQLEHRADRERHRAAGRPSEPGEWRHGNLPAERPAFYDRPFDEREVVRHKSVTPEELTLEEAVWDMTMLDFDFLLFREIATGHDTLLARRDGELVVSQVHPEAEHLAVDTIGARVDAREVPELSVREAKEWLDAADEPFVFYANASTGRGNVLYRRYDGHYGLITPA